MTPRLFSLFAVLSLGAALPCAAGMQGEPNPMLARSAAVLTDFFAAPRPDVASVAGVLHIARLLPDDQNSELAVAARESARILYSPLPGVESPSAAAKLAVLLHKPIFETLSQHQQNLLSEEAHDREAAIAPHRRRLHEILDRLADRMNWDVGAERSTLTVHLPDGSSYERRP